MREEYADLEEARVWTATQVGNRTSQSRIGSVMNGQQLAIDWKHKVASINWKHMWRNAPSFASSHMDEEDRCRIHSVSPYGCSHFDAHQTKEEADLRSSAGHYQVDLAWKNDHLYARIWLLLNTLGRVAPSPVESQARMRAAIEAQDSSSLNHFRE